MNSIYRAGFMVLGHCSVLGCASAQDEILDRKPTSILVAECQDSCQLTDPRTGHRAGNLERRCDAEIQGFCLWSGDFVNLAVPTKISSGSWEFRSHSYTIGRRDAHQGSQYVEIQEYVSGTLQKKYYLFSDHVMVLALATQVCAALDDAKRCVSSDHAALSYEIRFDPSSFPPGFVLP
jgi:hypothetical protein